MKKKQKLKHGGSWKSASISLLILLCAMSFVFADSYVKTLGQSAADQSLFMQPTADGGYISVGYTESFGVGGDIWIVKFSATGSINWQKRYGGSKADQAEYVVQTPDGGYVVVGTTISFGAGGYDLWLLKLDASGNILWQRTYGGNKHEGGQAVQYTSDGGFIVVGVTDTFASGDTDAWILKLTSSGLVTWQMSYGGYGRDILTRIQQTSDGGYITVGWTDSFGGAKEGWVMKLTSTGNITWQKKYGGAKDDLFASIQQTPDGGYVIAGQTISAGAGLQDLIVMKLDTLGNITWQKTYGGIDDETGRVIRYTSFDGGYIVGAGTKSFGAGESDQWLLKLTSAGSVVFQKAYGGSKVDSLTSVYYIASQKSYVIGGFTRSFGAGDYDKMILKVGSTGDLATTCRISTNTNVIPATSSLVGGNVYVTPRLTSARIASSLVFPVTTLAIVQTGCVVR